MLGGVHVFLLEFALNLSMHNVFLVKRRAFQVPRQSPELVRLYGIPEFYLGLIPVDAVVMIQVLMIYYCVPVFEWPSCYWTNFEA